MLLSTLNVLAKVQVEFPGRCVLMNAYKALAVCEGGEGVGRERRPNAFPIPKMSILNSWKLRLYYIKVAAIIDTVNPLPLKQGY